MMQALDGETNLDFLRRIFNKLLLNFSWWVNRKDRFGKIVFEDGFLCLDILGVFDRSAPLPTDGHQTGWTGLAAKTIQLFGLLDTEKALAVGKEAGFFGGTSETAGKK